LTTGFAGAASGVPALAINSIDDAPKATQNVTSDELDNKGPVEFCNSDPLF
jgi:hypothetical protein